MGRPAGGLTVCRACPLWRHCSFHRLADWTPKTECQGTDGRVRAVTACMRMSLTLALALTLSLVGCAQSSSPSASSTGIYGTVMAGPTCPVERAESPCPPRTWSGTVRATDRNGQSYDAETDARGNYSLSLPPGTYDVFPVTESALPIGIPTNATVTDGSMQRLDLQVDTGIR